MDTLSIRKYVKSGKGFLEFFINCSPLSELLDKFYRMNGSILDNWIGTLGAFENRRAEVIKVKQLLGKTISDEEIRRTYPSEWNDKDFQWYLERVRDELSNPEIIIYCCAECGGYDCGGIKAKIEKTENAFVWTFTEEEKQLMFSFDKYQYFDLFDKYLKQLEKKD